MTGENLKHIRAELGFSQEYFATLIGVSSRTIQRWEYLEDTIIATKYEIIINKIYSEHKNKIYTSSVDTWKHEELGKQNEEFSNGRFLPLIPFNALAGSLTVDNEGVTCEDCPKYFVPDFAAKGAEFLINVSGDSMLPKYNSGDILACRKIQDITFFQWGKCYVIDTCQGVIVKRVFEDKDNKDNIICVSENKDKYPPFSLPKTEIRSLSIVVGAIGLE